MCIDNPEGILLGQALILWLVHRNILEVNPVRCGALITAFYACNTEASSPILR